MNSHVVIFINYFPFEDIAKYSIFTNKYKFPAMWSDSLTVNYPSDIYRNIKNRDFFIR
jgi:hypothetical protein